VDNGEIPDGRQLAESTQSRPHAHPPGASSIAGR
jgi:hypothetical protein